MYYIFVTNNNLSLSIPFFCALSAATCIPIYFAGKLLCGHRIAFLSGLFYTLNITSIAHSPLLLSDTLFTAFVAGQLYFSISYYKNGATSSIILGSLLWAFAVYTRSMIIYWIILFPILIILHPHKKLSNKIIDIVAVIVISFLLITPWMLRNNSLGAGFRMETNSGNIYYHNGAALQSKITGTPSEEIREKWRNEDAKEFSAKRNLYPDENSKYKYKMEKFKTLVFQNPFRYLLLHFHPVMLFPDLPTFFEILGFTQTGQGTLDTLHRKGLKAAILHYFDGKLWLIFLASPALLLVCFVYLFCFITLIKWIILKKLFFIWLFLLFIVYFLFLPGPVVMPRYHLPALPLICIMAAISIDQFFVKFKTYFITIR
ncbi:MAG: glycosyltransferase family 39 protein [Candidatus Theseobacter exili]|nr:glycosyltransferase family 39 protein [Candidatus Theseobacter exili]